MTENTSPVATCGQSRSISEWAPEAMAMRGAPHRRPTVIIADDHLLMAQGLAKLVEEDLDVLAVVGNGRELLDLAILQIPLGGPNLALMDICMPEMSGVETTRKLREVAPHCKVILISMHSQPEFIREAFRVGASGYLLKLSAASELMVAIREVMNGNVYISSDIAKDALSSIMAPTPALSPRQRRSSALGCRGMLGQRSRGTPEYYRKDRAIPQDQHHD